MQILQCIQSKQFSQCIQAAWKAQSVLAMIKRQFKIIDKEKKKKKKIYLPKRLVARKGFSQSTLATVN